MKDIYKGVRAAKVSRADGWINASTGLGIPTSDKAVNAYFAPGCRLDDFTLSSLYHFDDICAKIVDMRPEEMFRVGYDVTIDQDGEAALPLREKAKELDLDCKILEAMCWGRLYGGSLIIVGATNGDPSTPLNEDDPGEVAYLTVVDRREVWIKSYYNDPLAPNYGKPEVYTIFPQAYLGAATKQVRAVVNVDVHESRCIRFDGARTDRRETQKLGGWTYSVLQKVYDVVRDFETLFRSMGYMVQDANQSVFKISGLIEQIASDPDTIIARMKLVENTRAVNRAVLLDVDEGEDFLKVQTTFSGVDSICDRFQQRLSAATGIPVTLLMGRSPAGMNATGESDLTSFYNSVARDQENDLKPKLLRLYKMLARSEGVDADKVTIVCRPLMEMSEAERADLEMKHAQKDKMYVDCGVLTPEEVAMSRFGDPDEFGLRIILSPESLKARQESLDLALENPDFSQTNLAMGKDPSGKPLPMPAAPAGKPGAGGGRTPQKSGATPPRPSNNNAPRK